MNPNGDVHRSKFALMVPQALVPRSHRPQSRLDLASGFAFGFQARSYDSLNLIIDQVRSFAATALPT